MSRRSGNNSINLSRLHKHSSSSHSHSLLWLSNTFATQTVNNESDSYIHGIQINVGTPHDCIPWLRSRANLWPSIAQRALDLLNIPAMSAKLERVFSSAKLTVKPVRNVLSDHSIEVLEALSYCYRKDHDQSATRKTIRVLKKATARSKTP